MSRLGGELGSERPREMSSAVVPSPSHGAATRVPPHGSGGPSREASCSVARLDQPTWVRAGPALTVGWPWWTKWGSWRVQQSRVQTWMEEGPRSAGRGPCSRRSVSQKVESRPTVFQHF